MKKMLLGLLIIGAFGFVGCGNADTQVKEDNKVELSEQQKEFLKNAGTEEEREQVYKAKDICRVFRDNLNKAGAKCSIIDRNKKVYLKIRIDGLADEVDANETGNSENWVEFVKQIEIMRDNIKKELDRNNNNTEVIIVVLNDKDTNRNLLEVSTNGNLSYDTPRIARR